MPASNKTSPADVRERSNYLSQRARVLQAELKDLREEKRQITEALRSLADKVSPEAKVMKQRRIYVSVRPVEAKAELDAVVAERRKLART
ncbi:hypothetical protein ACE7GA_05890 [Roseomonas sp. CCTCC AB2023176]|uniref:hypothetical protein n=1 Tax=Roseomonas sp. CCTCC AB2023176 TaxID=3342640 RepID=UPI0035DFBCA9